MKKKKFKIWWNNIFHHIFTFNTTKNNTNKNNTMNNQENIEYTIINGFYQHKNTLNTDTPKIVRIIGKSELADHYKSIDGDVYSKYELIQNWIPINATHNTETANIQKNKLKSQKSILFRDFDELSSNSNDESNEIDESITQSPLIQETTILTDLRRSQQPIDQETQFINNVINKSKQIQSSIISVNLNLNHKFDISKLRNSIELFDIDIIKLTGILTDILIGSDIEQFRKKVRNHVSTTLLQLLKDNELIEKNESIKPNKIKEVKETTQQLKQSNQINQQTYIDENKRLELIDKQKLLEDKQQELDNQLNNYLSDIDNQLNFFKSKNNTSNTTDNK